jgi:hypothetical protein
VTVASKYVSAPGLWLMIAGFLGLVPAVLQVLGMIALFVMKASPSMALGHPRDYASLDIVPILLQVPLRSRRPLGWPVWFCLFLLLLTAVHILSSLS